MIVLLRNRLKDFFGTCPGMYFTAALTHTVKSPRKWAALSRNSSQKHTFLDAGAFVMTVFAQRVAIARIAHVVSLVLECICRFTCFRSADPFTSGTSSSAFAQFFLMVIKHVRRHSCSRFARMRSYPEICFEHCGSWRTFSPEFIWEDAVIVTNVRPELLPRVRASVTALRNISSVNWHTSLHWRPATY